MFTLINYYSKIIEETDKVYPIEIPIKGAGKTSSFEEDIKMGMQEIIGIGIINPKPSLSGHGTLHLQIGDEEILPPNFRADLIAKYNPKFLSTPVDYKFNEYLFPLKIEAKNKPVQIKYTEPHDGNQGALYLYLLGKNAYSNLHIPKYKTQLIEIEIPAGSTLRDVEVQFKEKTYQSHNRVIGAMLLGYQNRLKKFRLSIDNTSVFPEGFPAQLITKEMVTATQISKAKGIFTQHIVPFKQIMYPVDLEAQNSVIEGSLWATPLANEPYHVYLCLLTIS